MKNNMFFNLNDIFVLFFFLLQMLFLIKNVWLIYIKGSFLLRLGDLRNSAACELCNVQGCIYIFDMEVYLMHCV